MDPGICKEIDRRRDQTGTDSDVGPISFHRGKEGSYALHFCMDMIQIIRNGYRINVEHPLVAVCEEEFRVRNIIR